MIHLAAGYSLKETATRARQAGLGELSSVAIHKRLLASEEWLRWLAAKERALLVRKTPKLKLQRRLRAVDATTVSEPGSTGTDWRLHYAINLTNLQCDFFELTDVHGGETWRRVPSKTEMWCWGSGLLQSGRGGARPARRWRCAGALESAYAALYTSEDKRLKVLSAVRRLKVGQHLDLPAVVKSAAGETFAGRLVALRRSAAATRREQRHIQQKASKQQKNVSSQRLRTARYLLIWTSLRRLTRLPTSPSTIAGAGRLN